jgi:hypothetical protein
VRGVRSAIGLGLAGLLLLTAGCGTTAPTATPPPTPSPAPEPTPTATPPAPTASPSASAPPTAPPGTTYLDIPEAGIRLPVPDGWEPIGADVLADPAAREVIAARYPGSGKLLGALDQLGSRAEPVFLAADPSAASLAGPLASNVSVLVSQPSVDGVLLDIAAGFIGDALTDVLGASGEPSRERVTLRVGEAVHFRYAIPAADGGEVVADAWVIGAPRGTLLVTLMGTASTLGALDPDAVAGAIVPLTAPGS